MTSTVFVCGATGTQGGAVTRYLVSKGVKVHALARDTSSSKAKDLEALGVKLWLGDFNNNEALASAIAGTDSIFINFYPDFTDLGANLRQARSILSIAKAAGAKHVVYSSGVGVAEALELDGVEKGSFFAQMLQSKVDIEEVIRKSDLGSWTILKPGNFMANYVNPFVAVIAPGLVESGRWTTAARNDTILPLTDTKTIGTFSGAALLQPEKFHGHAIAYADELMTTGVVLEKLSAATGRDLRVIELSDEEVAVQKATNPFIAGQLVMREMAKFIDLEEAKKWGIPFSSFDEYLEREKSLVQETYFPKA